MVAIFPPACIAKGITTKQVASSILGLKNNVGISGLALTELKWREIIIDNNDYITELYDCFLKIYFSFKRGYNGRKNGFVKNETKINYFIFNIFDLKPVPN